MISGSLSALSIGDNPSMFSLKWSKYMELWYWGSIQPIFMLKLTGVWASSSRYNCKLVSVKVTGTFSAPSLNYIYSALPSP